MEKGVGKTVEIPRSSAASLRIRLLGPIAVWRGDVPVPLPRSRKVRAVLGYLALNGAAVSRSRLCDLLWDVPNDPRGELRWCLSKLRGVLDDEGHPRVVATSNERIALDLSDCLVDTREIDRAMEGGVERLETERLNELVLRFGGDLLEGLQVDGSPEFSGWLVARRQHYRDLHVSVLRELAGRAPFDSEERLQLLHEWLARAPFDLGAHEALLATLLKRGRVRDGEEHLSVTIRSFEQEGLDWSGIRDVWRTLCASERTASERARDRGAREASAPPPPPTPLPDRTRRRVSVAVVPFFDRASKERSRVADGLTDDIITRLAKLRVLFVIARGSTFALAERGASVQEAGRILGVEYLVSGSVRSDGARVSVLVELADAESARIVWTDELQGAAGDTFAVLDTIVDRVVASIAGEIETAETQRALQKPPSSLDAWEAYHRGLFHMYKFTGPENHHAAEFFRRALELDPSFARAHAGLSFTHFQSAFLNLTSDHAHEVQLAFDAATRSVEADVRDPAAHWALGRALWLRGESKDSESELRQSIELSPNFALGHYTLGFVLSQSGDPRSAIEATDYSRRLSPFDPLQFAMLASRAIAHLRLDEFDEGVEWALKATSRPNAHVHILAIAVMSLVQANRREEARKFVARIRERVPDYTVESLLRAFHFDADAARRLRRAAKLIDFD